MDEKIFFREERRGYFKVIIFSSLVALTTLFLLFFSFKSRFEPSANRSLVDCTDQNGTESCTKTNELSFWLFRCAFALEFFPFFYHIIYYVISKSTRAKNVKDFNFGIYFHHNKFSMITTFVHVVCGIIILMSWDSGIPEDDVKGYVGVYCLCSAYSIFCTIKNCFQPHEMFGWFEIVLWDVLILIFVSIPLGHYTN